MTDRDWSPSSEETADTRDRSNFADRMRESRRWRRDGATVRPLEESIKPSVLRPEPKSESLGRAGALLVQAMSMVLKGR
jgi:hypothetical protein